MNSTFENLKISGKKFASTNLGKAFIIVAICVLIYYFAFYNMHGKDYEDFMFGYWVADDGFCEQSEIDSMMLFIGKPEKSKSVFGSFSGEKCRPAHMVINEDIMNQKLNIKYQAISSGTAKTVGKFSTRCNIDFDDECQIPPDVTFEFDVKKGSLRIFDGDHLYAMMYKDHEITNNFL